MSPKKALSNRPATISLDATLDVLSATKTITFDHQQATGTSSGSVCWTSFFNS